MLTRVAILFFMVGVAVAASKDTGVRLEGIVSAIAMLREAADGLEKTFGKELVGIEAIPDNSTQFKENLARLVYIHAVDGTPLMDDADFATELHEYLRFARYMAKNPLNEQ